MLWKFGSRQGGTGNADAVEAAGGAVSGVGVGEGHGGSSGLVVAGHGRPRVCQTEVGAGFQVVELACDGGEGDIEAVAIDRDGGGDKLGCVVQGVGACGVLLGVALAVAVLVTIGGKELDGLARRACGAFVAADVGVDGADGDGNLVTLIGGDSVLAVCGDVAARRVAVDGDGDLVAARRGRCPIRQGWSGLFSCRP